MQAAAAERGCETAVGRASWSIATAFTREGRGLEPGEIVLLPWVPGLVSQLVGLLAAIRARHVVPRPLTPAGFTGMPLQRRSLNGD